jgi:hypothetical protein
MKNSPILPLTVSCLGGLLATTLIVNTALGFDRYKNDAGDAGSNCSACHGDFTDGTSLKGTIFPSDNKHTMHRSGSYMDTDCGLCHTSGDGRNPFIGSSDGAGEVPGLGCVGCHVGAGLRAHHDINGVSSCVSCHGAEASVAESVSPPYYGTAFTLAQNPCNDVLASNTNENWSVGDFLGTDNDGNNVYDRLDPACSPYQILAVVREGNDVRVTWETTGGRTDVLQAAPDVDGPYTDVGSPIAIPGTSVITTNVVEVGTAGDPDRYYRIKLIP